MVPFFFFSIGGYLVIRGELSFGALLAVLIAQKDVASPWKELLDFYQSFQDSRIKYEQIIEQFQPPGMMDPRLLLAEPDRVTPLAGELSVGNAISNISARTSDGSRFSRVSSDLSFGLSFIHFNCCSGIPEEGELRP